MGWLSIRIENRVANGNSRIVIKKNIFLKTVDVLRILAREEKACAYTPTGIRRDFLNVCHVVNKRIMQLIRFISFTNYYLQSIIFQTILQVSNTVKDIYVFKA